MESYGSEPNFPDGENNPRTRRMAAKYSGPIIAKRCILLQFVLLDLVSQRISTNAEQFCSLGFVAVSQLKGLL